MSGNAMSRKDRDIIDRCFDDTPRRMMTPDEYKRAEAEFRIDALNGITPQELDAIARDWKFDDTPAPHKEPSETERRWAHNRKQRAKGRKGKCQ